MDDRKHYLYWREQLIGTITNVAYRDFPWIDGKIVLTDFSNEIREVLEYIHRVTECDDEDLPDWPFGDEFADDWFIVKPDLKKVEISIPVIDFVTGDITWR